MEIHKIALIASLLILPTQILLAATANHERLAQPAATKAVMVMPARKTTTSNLSLPNKKQNGVIAGPGGTAAGHTQTTVEIRDRVIARMGVNLKLLSFGWAEEICTQGCPELRTVGLAYSSCDLAFRVTNTGDVASGNFKVNLLRTAHTGSVVPLEIIANGLYTLAPHETKTFKISPDSVGLYKTGRPFTLTVDHLNHIAETNENDNSATFVPR